jgi:hypothetical protein
MVTSVPAGPDAGLTLEMLGGGVPVLLAGRNAASAAPQMSDAFNAPFADTDPAST